MCDKDTLVESVNINKNVKDTVDIVIKDNVTALMEKGSKIDTNQNIIYDKELYAPIKKGDKVGKIEILNKSDNSVIGSSDLIINQDVERSGFVDYFKKIFKMYLLKN